MDESRKNAEKGGEWGHAACSPLYLLQGILVCGAAGPGSLSLPELCSVSRARGRKSRKKSEVREGLSREVQWLSHTPILRGAQVESRKGIEEEAGRQQGGLHLLFKELRSQMERRKKGFSLHFHGSSASFEHDFRKEKARLKGNTKESQVHA